MIPKKFAPLLFGLLLSGLMSLLVSGLSTARAIGLGSGFPGVWRRPGSPPGSSPFPPCCCLHH